MVALAPNNASAWNYLRGVLDFTKTPYSSLTAFILPYTTAGRSHSGGAEDVVDLENPLPEADAELPCSAALEFLADIREHEGGAQIHKAVEVCDCRSQCVHGNKIDSTLDLEIIGERTRYHAKEVSAKFAPSAVALLISHSQILGISYSRSLAACTSVRLIIFTLLLSVGCTQEAHTICIQIKSSD